MADPEFQSADGLAATVLLGQLLEELMDNGVFGTAHRQRILEATLDHLDAMQTDQSARAANLVIDVFGIAGKARR
ncbi:MAG: hypothetical protein WBA73_21665 [Devosia sp.]